LLCAQQDDVYNDIGVILEIYDGTSLSVNPSFSQIIAYNPWSGYVYAKVFLMTKGAAQKLECILLDSNGNLVASVPAGTGLTYIKMDN
jgi:hypothetical protein